MKQRMLFFVNPNAGHTEIRAHLMDVLDIFTRGGYEVTVRPTVRAGEISDVIARECAGYDVVTIVGGDGTVNEAVSGLMQLTSPPLLGYLPGGTVNDIASTLRLPRSLQEAARAIVEGREAQIDLGRFNERWFAYVAAFGAFTDVSYDTPQSDKRIWGRLAYLMRGVQALGDIRPIHVRAVTADRTVEDDVIMGLVANTTSVGGFKAKPDLDISLNDGLSEVVLVKQFKGLLDLNSAAAALLQQDFTHPAFYTFRTDRIAFEFDEDVAWTLDGEYGGAVRRAEIENRCRALRIILPPHTELSSMESPDSTSYPR